MVWPRNTRPALDRCPVAKSPTSASPANRSNNNASIPKDGKGCLGYHSYVNRNRTIFLRLLLFTASSRASLERVVARGNYCGLSLALAATAGGITVVTGLQCSGEAKASVWTSFAQLGPKGTAAGHNTDLSESTTLAVTLSVNWTCWTAGGIYFSGWAGPRGSFLLGRPKRLALIRRGTNARDMQKRANAARAGQGRNFKAVLAGLSLALAATAGGITVVTGLQCSGEAKASVWTSFAQLGPKGTAAGHTAKCRTGWVYQRGPKTRDF
jgi:hypothetical protein